MTYDPERLHDACCPKAAPEFAVGCEGCICPPDVVDEAESVLTGANTPPLDFDVDVSLAVVRVCDLNKCSEPGFGLAHLNVETYTGVPGSTMAVMICKSHADQLEAGFIVGFAWTPVLRNQVPPQLRPEAP